MPRFIALSFAIILTALPARAEDLLIFAAASMRGALDEFIASWPGAPVAVSYAGSATLARQLEAGAPADIFISANSAWMDHLDAQGLLSRRQNLVSNAMVLAAPADQVESPTDLTTALSALPEDAQIASGFVLAVPAGIYARQSLEHLGRYDEFAPRLVQTENVRVALSLVARGEVPRALVYQSDVVAEPQVTIAATIPADHHDPILYPIGLLSDAPHPEAAALFAALLTAEAIFLDHGFEVLP